MNDDFRLGMSIGHLDRPSAQDRDTTNALLCKHIVEDRRADQPCRSSEYEMHGNCASSFDVLFSCLIVVPESSVVYACVLKRKRYHHGQL